MSFPVQIPCFAEKLMLDTSALFKCDLLFQNSWGTRRLIIFKMPTHFYPCWTMTMTLHFVSLEMFHKNKFNYMANISISLLSGKHRVEMNLQVTTVLFISVVIFGILCIQKKGVLLPQKQNQCIACWSVFMNVECKFLWF